MESAVEFGVTAPWGTRMFDNIPTRFLPEPEHLPMLTFGAQQLTYAWSGDRVNASEAFVDHAISRFGPDRPAITRVKGTERETWTYGDLLRRVSQTAAGLSDLGVRPGDRVLLRMPDVPETAVVQLAVWRLGAVTVPSSVLEAANELTYMLNDTEASVVVAASEYAGPLEKALPETPTVRHVVGWPAAVAAGPTLADIQDGKPEFFEPHATSALDASGIYYTGGTTGQPKACLHTHVAEIANADLANAARGADETWVFLTHAPIGHAFGCLEKVNLPLRAGASVIYMDRPSPADMWRAVLDLGVTSIGGAATMYRMMLADHPSVEELRAVPLKSAYSAGEALDPATQERWGELMPVPLRNVVGMTPMRGIFLESNQHGVKTAPGLAVGLPLPGYEARLSTEGGIAAAPGEPGRLAMRGPTGITYWINKHPNAVQRSRTDVVDGWSFLDDAYRRDEEGWLWFDGRLDDMVVTGGRQVAPVEVERVLLTHPAVAEVCVVAGPDELRGQIVTAFVVRAEDAAEPEALTPALQAFAKEHMASYKYPRRIEYLDKLPKDHVGKIQRRTLREALRERPVAAQTPVTT